MSRSLGLVYENIACEYLKKNNLILLEKNFQTKAGEIDLIMQDSKSLVFVEVKYRHLKYFGSSEDAVNLAKQKKLITTAKLYLQKKNLFDKIPCRFDVVAISGEKDPDNPEIQWIQDAFEAY